MHAIERNVGHIEFSGEVFRESGLGRAVKFSRVIMEWCYTTLPDPGWM
jgi:hypothetical protein